MPFQLKEESTGRLGLPEPLPAAAKEITFEVQPSTGAGPSGPATIPVERPEALHR